MKDVQGKVAFITGAASGMGLGMARAFSAAGMKVMLGDIQKEPLDTAVAELKAQGRDVAGVVVDVTDRDSVFSAAQATVDAFGKVHVCVNNAGVGASGSAEGTSEKNWRWTVDVNMWGVVWGLQAFMPLIEKHGEGGHVVNTASMAGMFSWKELSAYNASKYAVVAISETAMAEHTEDNIGVSVLCPGVVNTNLGTSARNRGDDYGGSTDKKSEQMVAMLKKGLNPDVVGEQVLEAIIDDQPYIFTDPGLRSWVENRFQRILAGYDWADQCDALKKADQQTAIDL
ncbi:MAG: SDR family NAD(P)-dependent oxidoreductase [Gammaproteobacteria bacterium]|nr:SDR family NAD(P)-dependent oxidoreductase [Gammaproteobacteria bacterium]MBQ0839358.1 SDR family NAD(P)-dependent oxidoreductase [Gammaproteobacteria bacterium]